MYIVVAGGGKVGSNSSRSLLELGHEITLIEQRPARFNTLAAEFGSSVLLGDATEFRVLERAGVGRPADLVLAVTGDDEDNLVIAQIAKGACGVRKVIARVNDPRNQGIFDLLEVELTVCATSGVLGLVEHEVPEHGLIRLLDLRSEGLAVVEVAVPGGSPAAGKRIASLSLPSDARVISLIRSGTAELVDATTVVRPGDQLVAVLKPGSEQGVRRALVGAG